MDLIKMLGADLTDVTRERVMALQAALQDTDPEEFPRLDCPLVHRFIPGIYAREIFMPAGTVAVGKIHLKDHMSVILGDVSFASSVEGLHRITGCETFTSKAGVKRVVVCHADTWWTTFHPNPTDERDLAKLEALLIAPDFQALDLSQGVLQ